MKMNTLKETMETDGYSTLLGAHDGLNSEISPPSKIENNRTSSIPDKKRLDQDAT